MKKSTIKKTITITGLGIMLILFAACGTNGDGFLEPGSLAGPGSGSGPINQQPVAEAGSDQMISSGATVTLDGSQSRDSDGDSLTYFWQFQTRPAGSSAAFSDPTVVSPTFAADKIGLYTISLVVSDGTLTSTSDTVNISAANDPPVANAGPDQAVDVGTLVTLDGSASSDVNGDSLTYSWMTQLPSGQSHAVLSDAYAVNPSFTPDVPGIYEFYLTVFDGIAYSSPWDKVVVTAGLTAVANAGPDQYHTTGPSTLITLDGSGSYDTKGKALAYAWSFTRKPAGSAAALSDPSSPTPTFTADLEGIYVVSLTMMNNGYANSTTDSVLITVVANRPVTGLSFKVIDAEYSKQMDRIIMVSGTPSSQLHIYDPAGDVDQTVTLPSVPTSVSVGPDGLYAAVGHNGSVSYVDLVSKAVVTTLSVSGTITDTVLAGNGYVYAFRDLGNFFGVNLSTGAPTAGAGYYPSPGYALTRAKLHPSGSVLYAAVASFTIQKYDIASGAPVFLYDSSYVVITYTAGGELWMTEDGTGIITRNGSVFSASTGTARDLAPSKATLEGVNYEIGVQYASDSSAVAKVAAIPLTSDIEVRIFDDQLFTLQGGFALPHYVSGNSDYFRHGKFVFYNSTGTSMYVIMQTDAAAGLVNDFGVVTY